MRRSLVASSAKAWPGSATPSARRVRRAFILIFHYRLAPGGSAPTVTAILGRKMRSTIVACAPLVRGGKCPLLIFLERTRAGKVMIRGPEPGRRETQQRPAQRGGVGNMTRCKEVAQKPDELRRNHQVADIRNQQRRGAELRAHARRGEVVQEPEARPDIEID